MSLITWITDYLYTPISFNLRRYKMKGIVIALLATFLVAGIWHGAALTFVLWGLLQGVIVSTEAITSNKKNAFEKKFNLNNKVWYISLSIVFTYFLFAFSLLIGGAVGSISDTFTAFNKIFTEFSYPIFLDKPTLFYASLGIILLFASEFRDEFFPDRFLLFNNRNTYIRWVSYFSVLLILFIFGVFKGSNFIYFNF